MAGSYNHAVTDNGKLRHPTSMTIATETQGDAYETIEEMYGMIWFLASLVVDFNPQGGNQEAVVEYARVNYRTGLRYSPGQETEGVEDERSS